MKTVLITGAAGMIGSNLVHYLLDNTDYEIVGLDDMSGGYSENLPLDNKRLHFLVGDVTDTQLMNIIFKAKNPDIVYHAAAYAAEGLSPFIRKFNYTNNLVGTMNIVNECINWDIKRLVFFSSIAVYGHGGGGDTFKEFYIPRPADPYGIAKYACERDLFVAGVQHNLDYVIVRPFNVYGERQNIWDRYRNVLGIWMYNYLNDKPIQIYGDGQQQRSFTYVQDIMDPLRELGTSTLYSRETFNIGSSIPYTLNELATIFKATVGDCEVQYLPARHEVKRAVCSVEKYNSSFKYDQTTLQAGMSKMWEWVQKQPKRQPQEGPTYEITKGMYEHWKI